jgi:hypothetical protein
VVLLKGPRSVGKRTIIDAALSHHGVRKLDVQRYNFLNVEAAREAKRFLSTRPMGAVKVVVIDLDKATPEALNALLKVMEEPPACARFLLSTSMKTLLTIESRAQVFSLGYLTDQQVFEILVERMGYLPDKAAKAARVAGGQVERALAASDLDYTKGPVLSLLRAASEGDEELLNNSLARFGPEEVSLLRAWAVEARSGVYRIFEAADGCGLEKDRKAIDRISNALITGARPRLAAKLALMDIVEARRG